MPTTTLSPTRAYHISPVLWEEPRCYWRSGAVGETVSLHELPAAGSAADAFRWMLRPRPDGTFNLASTDGLMRLDGNKLVLCAIANPGSATPFRLYDVGPCQIIEVADDSGRLIECEDGNLGSSTDIQAWRTSRLTDLPTDWTSIPAAQVRTLWKFDTIGVSSRSWMGALSTRNLRLHEIAIAGTHDTTTWKWDKGNYSRTQDLTVFDQLNAGIRFLDIRLGDDFQTRHGGKNDVSFEDVLAAIHRFLQQPGSGNETIVMSIARDGDNNDDHAAQFAQDVQVIVSGHKSSWVSTQLDWYTANHVPALSDVGGKVVLLRRYADGSANPPGMDLTHWPDNASKPFSKTVDDVTVRIQDHYYLVQNSSKKAAIELLFPDMHQPPASQWTINFTSAGLLQRPRTYSDDINPWLGAHLNFESVLCGVFPMDFPSPALIDRIIRFNAFG